MKMSGRSPQNSSKQTESELTLFAEASHAKTFHWREIARGLRERGLAYGRSIAASFAKYDQSSSSWKTSQACLLSEWEEFSETWPRSGMMRNGIAYRLAPLVPLTSEIVSGSLPTLRTSRQKRAWKAYLRQNYQGNLEEFLGECGFRGWISQTFCEWMMGFPLGWTVMKHVATPLSRKSQKSSAAR